MTEYVSEFFRKKKILITGGAGFIGSSLVHALVAAGAEVTVLDAMLSLYGGNMFNLEGAKDRIEFVQGDIRDEKLIAEAVCGKNFIFNLAAQVSYIDSKDLPFLDLEINCRGHLTVLEAARRFAPGCRVLFSSSRLVYGKILRTPVAEEHPTEPLSIYGVHKLTAEKYYRYYHDTFGLDTVIVRIPNPYGPRQQMKHSKYSVVGWFIRCALDGGELNIFGDGRQIRDYLYVDDIVSAFLRLAEHGIGGEVYNIGTREHISLIDMIDVILEEAGTGSKQHVPWPENYEKNETGDYLADTSKIERHTGWRAAVNLKEGIRRTVEYYKKYREYYW